MDPSDLTRAMVLSAVNHANSLCLVANKLCCKTNCPLPMFFELLLPHEDAHIRNSIMAAPPSCLIHGSHPFTTSFLNCQECPLPSSVMPLPSGPWNLQAFRGTEDDRMKHVVEEAKILAGSQGVHCRNTAISCVDTGCDVSIPLSSLPLPLSLLLLLPSPSLS